jgi:hypothetical protein
VRVRGKEVGCRVWVTERFSHAVFDRVLATRTAGSRGGSTEAGTDPRLAQEILLGIGGGGRSTGLASIATYHFNEGRGVRGVEVTPSAWGGMPFPDAWPTRGAGSCSRRTRR